MASTPIDHSYYYHRGSEAPGSMATRSASGHDALASDGMLAQPRHQPGVEIDIPSLGSVEIDIPHADSTDPEWSRPPGSITDDHVFDAPLTADRRLRPRLLAAAGAALLVMRW